ncbi:MAG: 2-oxoacid:ferredoxin oxidoreductase subunit beta, partial [Candidatus Limnocylindrales bacterium]
GKDQNRGLRLNGHRPQLVTIGEDGVTLEDILVHDEDDPLLAAMLASIYWPEFPVPVGVIRAVQRPTHAELLNQQVADVIARKGPGDLAELLEGGETWLVTGDES